MSLLHCFSIQEGSTALHEASDAGHTAVVPLLLDHRADVNAVGREVGDLHIYVVEINSFEELFYVNTKTVCLLHVEWIHMLIL